MGGRRPFSMTFGGVARVGARVASANARLGAASTSALA